MYVSYICALITKSVDLILSFSSHFTEDFFPAQSSSFLNLCWLTSHVNPMLTINQTLEGALTRTTMKQNQTGRHKHVHLTAGHSTSS